MTCSQLIHNLFTTFLNRNHNLFKPFLGLVHLSTDSSWPVHNLFKTFLILVHILFMACSWPVNNFFTIFSKFVHDFFRTCCGLVHTSYEFMENKKLNFASWPKLGTAQPQLVRELLKICCVNFFWLCYVSSPSSQLVVTFEYP